MKTKKNGDILYKTLVIIDEAHFLYGKAGAMHYEKPNMTAIEKAINFSYQNSGKNSVKILLMTATPITDNPIEFIQLINLCKENKNKINLNQNEIINNINNNGWLNFINNNFIGYISYLNRSTDASQFAQVKLHYVDIDMSTIDNDSKDNQEYAIMNKCFEINDKDIKKSKSIDIINKFNKVEDVVAEDKLEKSPMYNAAIGYGSPFIIDENKYNTIVKIINDNSNENYCYFKTNDLCITNYHIKKLLLNNGWLNNEIIDSWMELLNQKYNNNNDNYFVRCNFFQYFNNNDHKMLAKMLPSFSLIKAERIFIPINVNDSHWCLIIIYNKFNTIKFYDSLHNNIKDYGINMNLLKTFLNKDNIKKKEWKIIEDIAIPKQNNNYDCGIFVCILAYYKIHNLELNYTTEDMKFFRKIILLSIYDKEINKKNNEVIVIDEGKLKKSPKRNLKYFLLKN